MAFSFEIPEQGAAPATHWRRLEDERAPASYSPGALGRVKGSLRRSTCPVCRALDSPDALPSFWQLPDPTAPIEPATAYGELPNRLLTAFEVAEFVGCHEETVRRAYVNVEPLKSRAGMLSQLRVLTAQLGELPASALERPGAIEDFKA